VESLFELSDGKQEVQHDHSMSYRHRNRHHYPYQNYTFQELTGLINLLYIRIAQPTPMNRVDLSPQFFTDWNLALMQLTGSSYLGIDNRRRLIRRLRSNLPIAYFPGDYIMYELEFFALQSIRTRLNLQLEETISRELLDKEGGKLMPVYIFAQEINLGKQLNKDEVTDYIVNGVSEELKLLYEFEVIRIIRTKQISVGIHFPQLGKRALRVLRKIKEQGGYILSNRKNAAMMTDMVDMDRFHIGKVISELTASIMGIPVESGYIQFVPAGVRTSLSYPSPVQTSKDFERALKSRLYRSLEKEHGEAHIMSVLREDAATKGSPVMHVLQSLDKTSREESPVHYEYLSGIYSDGMPYNGALARINLAEKKWDFKVLSSADSPKTVLRFTRAFERKSGKKARIAWNGGYILNPELVGKLGLPETYIGSPLGLIISEGRMISAPLFNKPALLVNRNGSMDIRRVHCREGIGIKSEGQERVFNNSMYNPKSNYSDTAFYDLFYSGEYIETHGRTIVRLAGDVVKEIIDGGSQERVKVVPVGLTLAFAPGDLLEELKEGDRLELSLPGYEEVLHGVEAGPLLIEHGKAAIDMEGEGWKTGNSIRTQAARLDYTGMRGPKIAVGINREGQLEVLTINGRIRESVGATHADMAHILLEQGLEKAMGFDPGGSSTLVVDGRTLNISPYNSDYEKNVYALPPEPRAVSNAIIGYLEE